MAKPGYTTLGVDVELSKEIEQIKEDARCKTKTEALRHVLRVYRDAMSQHALQGGSRSGAVADADGSGIVSRASTSDVAEFRVSEPSRQERTERAQKPRECSKWGSTPGFGENAVLPQFWPDSGALVA